MRRARKSEDNTLVEPSMKVLRSPRTMSGWVVDGKIVSMS